MNDLDAVIEELEAIAADADAKLRALRQENTRLRDALEAARHPGHGEQPARTVQVLALEAERENIRSRLRSLLDTLQV